jgi:hypothetical protein
MNINRTQSNLKLRQLMGKGGSNPFQLLRQLLGLMKKLLSALGQGSKGRVPKRAGFGGNSRGRGTVNPGSNLSNFLGSKAKHGQQTRAARSLGTIGRGSAVGRKIAQMAARTTDRKGYCFRAVAKTMAKFGVPLSGASAYMAADQLARNPKMREVRVSRQQLKSLPAGAVVVWNRGRGLPHGHIGIALGNGKEASWKVRPQLMLNTSFRVFVPK